MAKILVVDDDPDFVESTRMVLEPNGYEVVSAANSEQGLKKLAEEKPDLVVLDVIMSTVLDGLSMSQRMSENLAFKGVPILMVTSIANTDYAALFPTDEYINISAFLTKPISSEQLLGQIKRLLSSRQA
ncbi:MAG: response regulator [Anaerolineae bacterium]|nr:response regulator [Anaerolineae bacterium]